MVVSNLSLVRHLRHLADLLEISGADAGRVRAHRRAAEAVLSVPQPLPELLAAGFDLASLPGIGPAMEALVRRILAGERPAVSGLPDSLAALRHVDGLGPKRTAALWSALAIADPAELLAAARAGRLARVEGFGPRLEEALAQAAQEFLAGRSAVFLATAEEFAAPLLEALPGALLAGEARRRAEAVDELLLLVPGELPDAPLPPGARLVSREAGRATVLLANGLRVGIRAVDPACLGTELLFATGSAAHVEQLRHLAASQDLELTPAGLLRAGRPLPSHDEDAVYAALGLPPIPPELRHGADEIDLARQGRLPRLVEPADIRADLHTHSTWSDGRHTLEEMAAAAMRRGLAALGVADHSAIPGMRLGLAPAHVLAQMAAIDDLNAALDGRVTLLKGCEVEILPDGALGLPDDILARLDYVLCSVHTAFDQPRTAQTARLLRAMEHPACRILGHPSGRAVGMFPAMDLDMDAVIAAAASRGVILELDAKRDRMDMSDDQCRQARAAGCAISISTDSHNVGGLSAMVYGVGIARRAGLEAADVVNTLPVAALRNRLRAKG